MEHIKASRPFDGLLDLKVKSSQRGDIVYLRELQVIFDEVNGLVTFLCLDHEKIVDFINTRGDITRQFHLDRQAKGVRGLSTRRGVKQKMQQSVKSLGEAPRIFVPLANVLISVENTGQDVDKVRSSL